jgi:hypothetical protein
LNGAKKLEAMSAVFVQIGGGYDPDPRPRRNRAALFHKILAQLGISLDEFPKFR